jgi:hypothetical protein
MRLEMKKAISFLVLFSLSSGWLPADQSLLFLEAESFENKGGWVVDQQFMDQMGSPFLMAHGLGVPVADAETRVDVAEPGEYRIWVRTRNWAGYWSEREAPGRFQVLVNGKAVPVIFGTGSTEWGWHDGGLVTVQRGRNTVALRDLTGFNGRCDAVVFVKDAGFQPINDPEGLRAFRRAALGLPGSVETSGKYDLVVVGGGVAGTCAAISAARLGLKVALIQNRPVLGGNNSSEVRVHLGGRILIEPFPKLGQVVNEIGPLKPGNAQPAENYEDDKKLAAVRAEANIDLFLNWHVFAVEKEGNRIQRVLAKHIENSSERAFQAPLFADCTGDATVGYLAGARYMMGREGKDEFGEKTAPEKADKMTMGSSVQWYAREAAQPVAFPDIQWGIPITAESVQVTKWGEWTWETGMHLDQVKDFERVRDYGLIVVYSNWSFLKNHYSGEVDFKNSELDWVAYISGKRESRRLVGDLILREQDLTEPVLFPDGSAPTTWTIDLHYPDPENSKHFPGAEFLSIAVHKPIHPYPIPYRCLYSRDIDNLLMAGRNISVTHVTLGTVRVMRTTGMMGEVVGMAASLCRKYDTNPRGVYNSHLKELIALMKTGVGLEDLKNQQRYNQGTTLGENRVGPGSLPQRKTYPPNDGPEN